MLDDVQDCGMYHDRQWERVYDDLVISQLAGTWTGCGESMCENAMILVSVSWHACVH